MNKLRLATIIILFLVVGVLATVLAVVWSMPDIPATDTTGEICLPNAYGAVECGETMNILHTFLEQSISETYGKLKSNDIHQQKLSISNNRNNVRLQNLLEKYFIEMKPAAKLTGKDQTETREGDKEAEMTPIREWCHGRELYDTNGFERYGVRYRNGRLVVPVSGTYFVYSMVDLFEPLGHSSGQPDILDSSKPLRHAIYKFSVNDIAETEVISSVQPHTVSSNKYFNSYSSYISSLVELKSGDELSVKVSNLTYLRYTRDNTFGTYLI